MSNRRRGINARTQSDGVRMLGAGVVARIETGSLLAQIMDGARPKRPKYGNRRVRVDGIDFDSKREADRYGVLVIRQRRGEIADLECHPSFALVVNGHRIGRYTADFAYREVSTGERVVEDVKSEPTRTQAYRLRVKLMKACHGIAVREVM